MVNLKKAYCTIIESYESKEKIQVSQTTKTALKLALLGIYERDGLKGIERYLTSENHYTKTK